MINYDVSEAAIAKRNVEMRQVLAEWRETGDEIEQTENIRNYADCYI
jgi:hypothetical protein